MCSNSGCTLVAFDFRSPLVPFHWVHFNFCRAFSLGALVYSLFAGVFWYYNQAAYAIAI